MKRIILHWSAGRHVVSDLDKEHYHFIVGGDGKVVMGNYSVSANEAPIRGGYAAHTLKCNTGSIGIAMAAMVGAVERPFNAGVAPITTVQLWAFCALAKKLAVQYKIPITRETVLTHAEVQPTLGIAQRGKWDICWIPGLTEPRRAVEVGDTIRKMIVDSK